MSLFGGMDASASGLTAERLRLDLIASNLANLDTAGGPGRTPYRRAVPVFQAVPGGPGDPPQVRVVAVVQDPSPFVVRHDPGSPNADANGDVLLPNVDVVGEMVDMLGATRAYEANATAFDAGKQVFLRALEMGR